MCRLMHISRSTRKTDSCFAPVPRTFSIPFFHRLPALLHLDKSLQVHMAIRCRSKRCTGHHHDRRTPERVSKRIRSLSKSFGLRLPVPMRLCDFTSMLTLRCFRKDNIAWECENGGQLWTDSVTSGYDNGTSFPSGFCASGFSSLYAAFIGALLVDLVFQVCTWWRQNINCHSPCSDRCTCYS